VSFNTFRNFSVLLRQTPARLAAGLEAKNLPRFLTLRPDNIWFPRAEFLFNFGALNCVRQFSESETGLARKYLIFLKHAGISVCKKKNSPQMNTDKHGWKRRTRDWKNQIFLRSLLFTFHFSLFTFLSVFICGQIKSFPTQFL
jgi:hypothetical protein